VSRLVIGFLGVALCAPVVAVAQELTVDEFVATALEQSPALGAARTDIDAARGRLVEAGLRPNPMVGSSRLEMLDGPDTQTMVEVQWPLDLFRRQARVTAGRRDVEATSLSVADRERLLAAMVREQAGRALEARRSLDIVRDVLAIDRQLLMVIGARVREGATPRLDLEILQVEVQRAEAQDVLQAADVETSLIDLRALAGLPPQGTTTLAGSLEEAVREGPETRPTDASGPEVVERRADVRAAVARVGLAEAQIAQVRREGWLDATVVGEYGRMTTGFPQRAFDDGGALVPIEGLFNNLRVGVMVSVPMWDRNQGSVAAASAARARAQHDVEANRLAASAEIAAAETRARAAQRAVELYAAGAREQARRNLDVVREAYELGRSSLVNVLDEQRRYLDVEAAYTQALSAAYQARTAVRRATGDVK
jgi:cobalt-zinc-cadmium efflux system outer membrane protein